MIIGIGVDTIEIDPSIHFLKTKNTQDERKKKMLNSHPLALSVFALQKRIEGYGKKEDKDR